MAREVKLTKILNRGQVMDGWLDRLLPPLVGGVLKRQIQNILPLMSGEFLP